MLNTILTVLFVVLFVLAVLLLVLYFFGRKLEKRQVEQKEMMEAAAQTVSMLVIDKKKLKLKEANLPKIVAEQTPKYMRWAKLPIVKAKIGPKIVTLIADERVFLQLPVKAEVKVVLSGLYITELKSVRGGSPLPLPKKKGISGAISRFVEKRAAGKDNKTNKKDNKKSQK
ncbi:MAG: hypothetical protein Q4D90_00515 [bacterium]|nr:hypothetical protein [bacterium]